MQPEPVVIPMRDVHEVQRAHDLLVGVLVNEHMRQRLAQGQIDALAQAANVLCWILGHDYNDAFAEILVVMEELFLKEGFVLYDSGRLNKPGEADGPV